MMVTFLIMATETDGKPANDYYVKDGVKPENGKRRVKPGYMKKLWAASQHFGANKRDPDCC